MIHNTTKQCSKCRRMLSVIHFASSGAGLEPICRRCASLYKKNSAFHKKQSEAHPEYRTKAARKALDTPSGKARQALRNVVYRGKLPKPDYCEICTKKMDRKELMAHHVDYDHKLEIIWACPYCHGILDSVLREAEAALADTNHEGCPWEREFRYPLTGFIVNARCLGLLETEFFAWLREFRQFLADEEEADRVPCPTQMNDVERGVQRDSLSPPASSQTVWTPEPSVIKDRWQWLRSPDAVLRKEGRQLLRALGSEYGDIERRKE